VGPDLITRLGDAQRLADDWSALARDLGAGYFDSPDWTLAWWEIFGPQHSPRLAVWRAEDGSLDALMPLCRDREELKLMPGQPWAALRVWSNIAFAEVQGGHRAVLCRASRADDVAQWIGQFGSRHPFVLHNLDPELDVPLVREIGIRIRQRVYTRSAISSEDRSRSGSVKRARGRRRALERSGVEITRIDCGAVSESLLASLFELHALRRAAAGKVASHYFTAQQAPLLLRLSELGGTTHGPLAVVAKHGQTVVGVALGFLWGGTFTTWQHGWHPDFASYSLGSVLRDEAISFAEDSGAREFDFGEGQDPYKYRFGTTERTDETWLVPGGVKGIVLGCCRTRSVRTSAIPVGKACVRRAEGWRAAAARTRGSEGGSG
jgi:CelD/BcsL family acetyltransferase involved in cellulose biosynthesis